MEEIKNQHIWKGIDLEKMRFVMDPPSDDLMKSVYDSKSSREFREMLTEMASNDALNGEKTLDSDSKKVELDKRVKKFIDDEVSVSFTEEDIRMFNKSREVWHRDGMKFVIILLFRALPYTYMAEKPANVLHTTKLLEEHTDRRIIETAQFVFDVMEKNWWEPDKRGILTSIKIRLMHSAMRHIILKSKEEGKQWNEAWGMPISQEDLIATNQVFSLEFIKGMKMIGQELSRDEQEAWFHTWRVIAKIMGVQKEMIPANLDEAWELQLTIYDHLFHDKTVAGKALAVALVKGMHRFKMPERLVLFLMKNMLEDERFPDCFDKMLREGYGDKYPDLFKKHDSPEEAEKHKKEVLHRHAHEDALEYHKALQTEKEEIKRKEKKKKTHEGVLLFILDAFLKLLGIRKEKIHRIEIEVKLLHNILHDVESGAPLEKIEEDSIMELITVLGGVMVSFLSVHFRKGKESGFRIPKDLKEDWALQG